MNGEIAQICDITISRICATSPFIKITSIKIYFLYYTRFSYEFKLSSFKIFPPRILSIISLSLHKYSIICLLSKGSP